jgi:hypothetical protein
MINYSFILSDMDKILCILSIFSAGWSKNGQQRSGIFFGLAVTNL